MTMVIQIPSPTGYVNLGDCMILLGALALGPIYGAVAGGVGSALADLLSGWAAFAPGTFVIKGGVAVIAASLCGLRHRSERRSAFVLQVIFCAIAEMWMVLGYFIYEALVLGYGWSAGESVPGNLMQGLVGVVLANVLYRLLAKTALVKKENKIQWK